MKIKLVEVSLLSLVLSVMTCSAIAEPHPLSNARAALFPIALGIVEDMESIEATHYTEEEVVAAANSEQFIFRATVKAICAECYADLIEKERHDGTIWPINKITDASKNGSWQLKGNESQ